MSNSLNEEIEDGDVLLIDEEYMKSENPSRRERMFEADGNGFGASPSTMGSAVYGKWLESENKARIEGYMIEERVEEVTT